MLYLPGQSAGSPPPINRFVIKQHFKMEGARVLKDLLKQGDWTISIDLEDAYQSVPIYETHRKFLHSDETTSSTSFNIYCLG